LIEKKIAKVLIPRIPFDEKIEEESSKLLV
jgi:hypothetical protein